MSTTEEQITAFNEKSEIKFGEPESDSSFRVILKDDKLMLIKRRKSRTDKIKLPKSLLADVTTTLVELNKIINPRNGNKKAKAAKEESKTEVIAAAAPTEAVENKPGKKRERRRKNANSEAPKEDAVHVGAALAESLLDENEEAAPKKKRDRKRNGKGKKQDNADTAADAPKERPARRRNIDPFRAKVKNLSFDYTEESFAGLLKEKNINYESIVWKMKGKVERSFSGYCFVQFASADACNAFIEGFSNVDIGGRSVTALPATAAVSE